MVSRIEGGSLYTAPQFYFNEFCKFFDMRTFKVFTAIFFILLFCFLSLFGFIGLVASFFCSGQIDWKSILILCSVASLAITLFVRFLLTIEE